MSTAIQIEGLAKRYVIRHEQARQYTALRDVIADGVRGAGRYLLGRSRKAGLKRTSEDFWALRDISLSIGAGERVGVIGRNGAGKSTLLKVLSRITEPTAGRIVITGRVSSLLEVGTGFHPELTGRENIFLNGAVMGMAKSEIKRKFDEIVAFADVEKFLDTPVKRYSSGMYVRLAFSVAAHLEPEILIVDEVLAVGDMAFQRKCLGKLEEVGSQGRTVLFVSHNMGMISNLCQKGIVLDGGRVTFEGNISEAVLKYYEVANRNTLGSEVEHKSEVAKLLEVELVRNDFGGDITIHDELIVRMKYELTQTGQGQSVPNFHFFASDGSYAFVSNANGPIPREPGVYKADCRIPGGLLNEGAYFVGVALTTFRAQGSYDVEFFDRNALTFNVIDPMDELSNRYGYGGPIPGTVRPSLEWNITRD